MRASVGTCGQVLENQRYKRKLLKKSPAHLPIRAHLRTKYWQSAQKLICAGGTAPETIEIKVTPAFHLELN
jgi:hypothetical protein